VPPLDVRQAVMKGPTTHCFCEAVAHREQMSVVGEKRGLERSMHAAPAMSSDFPVRPSSIRQIGVERDCFLATRSGGLYPQADCFTYPGFAGLQPLFPEIKAQTAVRKCRVGGEVNAHSIGCMGATGSLRSRSPRTCRDFTSPYVYALGTPQNSFVVTAFMRSAARIFEVAPMNRGATNGFEEYLPPTPIR
jgi:hypothetical protein